MAKKNQKDLSVRAGKYVFSGASEEKCNRFCQEIEKFLELIQAYLLTDKQNVLNQSALRMSFAVDLYVAAFIFIVKKIPKSLPDEAIHELQYAFGSLMELFPLMALFP